MSTLHLIISVLSLIFFCTGMVRFFSVGKLCRRYSILIAGYGFLYLLWVTFYAVCYYFTGKGIDYSVLYHVKYGLAGAGFGQYDNLIYGSLFFLFFFSAVGCYYLFSSSKGSNSPSRFSYLVSLGLLLFAAVVHPATVDLALLSRQSVGEPFLKYYRTPYLQATGVKPRNFVFIYAESLERTYFDEQIFPGLIKHLNKLEDESIAFTNIGKYPETGWTIAGMVASQCGIPLIAPSHGNSMGGMDSFLAGATCMGDLLNAEGYHLAFMGGASLEFAGKGKFYQSHNFSEVLGRNQLEPLLPDKTDLSDWGLHDDSLFDLAFHKFEYLSDVDKPFGLFVLTLDTHSGDHVSKSCQEISYGDGKNSQLNTIACSDYLINDFIDRLRKSPLYDDTVIVVASDHYAMRPGVLRKSKKRRNLFFVIDPKRTAPLKLNRKGSTLDTGSTVLGVLGYTNYLGLGRNLLAGEASILEAVKHIDTTLKGWRKDIIKFWSFPEIVDFLRINSHGGSFAIDDRKFTAPALIQYDEKLQTKLWFERSNAPHHKTLLQHLVNLEHDSPFLLINACNRIPDDWTGSQRKGRCLISGKLGSETMKVEQITDKILLSAERLREIADVSISDKIYENRMNQIVSFQKKRK